MTQVLKLESKTAKILYAVIAGIIVHFIWFNTNIVTDYFNISTSLRRICRSVKNQN